MIPTEESQLTSETGGLDPGIREIVRILRAGNVETFESCEGSPGHAFYEPTVRFHGQQPEGFRALAWARQHGLRVLELRRYWTIEDGEPVGPRWEMTFAIDARLHELDGRSAVVGRKEGT